MYLNAETQARVLARFHYALDDRGHLFLGSAERLLTHAHLFAPVEAAHRLFAKVPKLSARDQLLVLAEAGGDDRAAALNRQLRFLELAIDVSPTAQVVLDVDGQVRAANDLARRWFRLGHADIGRPLQELELSYRPVELRSMIEQALSEGRGVSVSNALRPHAEDGARLIDVFVTPLTADGGAHVGVSVTFVDVTTADQLRSELEHSKQQLEAAYEELQSANEELETTNEELQSTNEELETTNEELQSSNEELETINEELESTNSELQAINDEIVEQTGDVERANVLLNSVMTSLELGVIVVDRDLRVQMWNSRSEDLWGVRADEAAGRALAELDIGLPLDEIVALVAGTLDGESKHRELRLTATNRRGKHIGCRVIATPLPLRGPAGHGAVLLVEQQS
jgi:two-component system CheB/CheR fusion protein